MYNVYFDSGTSNTRAYLIKDDDVVDVLKENLGSKDSSIAGSNLVLIRGLKELYDQLLKSNELNDKDISGIYASGMVTSPFGIKEVPHLSTPVSLKKLSEGMYTYFESRKFNREIFLIRGIKTINDDFEVNKYNIPSVNNMRGEEIEIFGILSSSNELKSGNTAIFLPGSHTHIAYIKQGIVHDILATFSGELYHAISKATILSGSIDCNEEKLDEKMIIYGFNNLKEYGINRALYIAHAMKVFDTSSNKERNSYLLGVISGGVILAFEYVINNKWVDVEKVLIAGSNNVVKVYEILLKEIEQKLDVITQVVTGKEGFAVVGLLEILKMEGRNVKKDINNF